MDAQLLEFLYKIGNLALVPLAGILVALGTLATQKIKLYSMSIKGIKLDALKFICTTSVQSAQQKYKAGMIKDKKASAMETAKKLCVKQGISITDALLSELIESGVWDEINSPAAAAPIVAVPVVKPAIIDPAPIKPEEKQSDIVPLG